MMRKRLKECHEITAGDGSRLREIMNPGNEKQLKIRYSLAWASVAPGQETLPHILGQSEVYYILRGSGIMRIGRERRKVQAGDAIYIPPGSVQQIRNPGRRVLAFLCLVDPAWRPAGEKILKMR